MRVAKGKDELIEVQSELIEDYSTQRSDFYEYIHNILSDIIVKESVSQRRRDQTVRPVH